MPGTFTFRPIEANLTHNTDLIGKMNPYCSFQVGNVLLKSQICHKGGKHPHWNDAVTIPDANEPTAIVDLMDKDKITKDDTIGTFTIDLEEIRTRGSVSKWYPLFYKNKPAGEILLEGSITGGSYGTGLTSGVTGTDYAAGYGAGTTGLGGSAMEFAGTNVAAGTTNVASESFASTTGVIEERVLEQHTSAYQPGNKFYTEQSQSVTGQHFVKEVDVIETVPVQKVIETTVPQKVLKSVQVTEQVPVTREVEVVEPVVVKQFVETVEPRLVTKTIQVVEDVPVTKEVEVVQMVPHMETIQTVEPQIVTRQVEVTEQVPVAQTVTTTEPVTVKKMVEFEQPIVTTKTITKELQQPVTVDTKITTEVGAAHLVHGSETVTTHVGTAYTTGSTYTTGTTGAYTTGAYGVGTTGTVNQTPLATGGEAFLMQQEGYTTGVQSAPYDTTTGKTNDLTKKY